MSYRKAKLYCMLKHLNVIMKVEKKRRRILKTEKEIENFMSCSYMIRKKQRERAIEEKDRNLGKESYLPLVIVIQILINTINTFITFRENNHSMKM